LFPDDVASEILKVPTFHQLHPLLSRELAENGVGIG
jgi:hypothetical protein